MHIYFENALKYIRRCEEEYDLIIVDSSDPFGPSEGLFTRELDRKSTRLNSSHSDRSRMPSSA